MYFCVQNENYQCKKWTFLCWNENVFILKLLLIQTAAIHVNYQGPRIVGLGVRELKLFVNSV